MALAQKKNGGPYNKEDQTSRRNEVYRLHFEYGYSARKIADLMKVNRNTINADIEYWYANIKEELQQDKGDLILQQLGRLEAQRSRIVESLTDNKNDSVKYEKLLLDIDAKINNVLMHIKSSEREEHKPEDNAGLIRNIVLFLAIKHSKNPRLSKDELISEIVNLEQCTVSHAEKLLSEMMEIGLQCCRKFTFQFEYDLLEFAILRKYVKPNDEFVKNIQTLYFAQLYYKGQKEEIEEKFEKECGKKESWNDDTFEKFDKEKDVTRKRHIEKFSELVASASQVIDDEIFTRYAECINMFFDKDSKPLIKNIFDD